MHLFPGVFGLWLGRALGLVAALDLFAMMSLTFVDVLGRKMTGVVPFAKPVYGAYELTTLMMGVLIFSVLPLVTAREAHITIDVFDSLVPQWARRGQRVVVLAVSTVVLAMLCWRLWVASFAHAANNEVTMTLYIPHYPFSRSFAILAGLAAIACAACTFYHLVGRENPNGVADEAAGGGAT